jgi:hypothetical protein
VHRPKRMASMRRIAVVFKNRFMDSEWPQLKGKVPYKFGALPCVVVNGKRFRETTAILRMLAIRFGLCTMDPASNH